MRRENIQVTPSDRSSRKRVVLLAAGLLACGGLVFVAGRGGVEDVPEGPKLAAGISPPQAGNKKSRDREVLSGFTERLLAADWSQRRDLFREALEKKEVPLEELWMTFQELDKLPGEKFGVGSLAGDLFAAYAERDPVTGLANFESLNAGTVRRRALMGFATNLPSEYVPALVESVRSNGFPDEELAEIAALLHTAARRYSPEQLKAIIDARYFGDTAQQELTWMYEGKLYQLSHPIPAHDLAVRTREPEAGTTGGVGEEKSDVEETKTTVGISPVMKAFNSQLSTDRFGAANGLQRGVFDKEIVSPQLIKNVSSYLTSEDPLRALAWAGNWDDPKARETAVGSVVWSWVRSDPTQCTTAINAIKDRQVRDFAVAEVAEYLISHQSLDEASTWISGISDPALKKRSLERLAKAGK